MNKMLWLDLEMTGLDVNREVIIEVGVIVADLDFKEYETFETVVKQPQTYLDSMDAWNKEHHTASGLLAKIPQGLTPEQTELRLLDLVQRHFPDPKNKPMLAGNSIGQDRLFIDRYFKNFAEKLHYRMLDVTSWKVVFQSKFSAEFKKKNNHRSIDDIRESMAELQHYLQFVKAPLK